LPVSQSVKDVTLLRGNAEDGAAVAYEAEMAQVIVHVAVSTQVIPRPADALQ
jgi:hypothetical protein